MHEILIHFITLCAAAVFFVPLFRYFGLGAILAYLFAGLIIGPHVVGLIEDSQKILHISELGVIFLLFIIGLELAPQRLWSMRNLIFGLGSLQVLLTGGLLMGAGLLWGLSLPTAYLIGFALALSSTAFSLQILQDHHQRNTTHGEATFAILMFQDIAVVPLIASLSLFAGAEGSPMSGWDAAKALSVLILLGAFGHYLVRHVLRLVADSRAPEVFTATTLLLVVGSALLVEWAGLSLGLGAFLAGVFLANSEYRHELETSLAPFKGLLLGLFFIAVGAGLDLTVLGRSLHWVLLMTFAFMLIKGLVIYILGRLFGLPKDSARNSGFTLALGGEFAFMLFATGVSKGLLETDMVSLLSASVTLSMALTPFLFSLNQRFLRTFSEIGERPYDQINESDSEVIVAGFGRFGQIIARFLAAHGIRYTLLDHSAGQVEIARRFGNKVYYGDASREDILESAGAKNAKVFILAIDEPESSVATARVVRAHFPHLTILARARNRQHALDLMELGVEHVVRETYYSSLQIVREFLQKRQMNEEVIENSIARFIDHDAKILATQFKLRSDEESFVQFTRNANRELEQLLSTEANERSDKDPRTQTKF